MAKLKAPLMSLGAAGALGKALVFFGWKGIDVVREYVVPANPRSTAQTTQRNRMTAAVTEWHGATYTAKDVTAWNRLAGVLTEAMSGFNRMCKEFIDQHILGNTWERLNRAGPSAVLATGFTFGVYKTSGGNAPTIRWGTRKTHFPDSASMVDQGNDLWVYTITGLTASTLYYITIDVGTSGTDYGRTGIYQQRTTA